MKILFLHLSDLHIKSRAAVSKMHIDKILDSLRLYGSFDKLFLIFSGDIAFSGTIDQYKAGSSMVARIYREVRSKGIYRNRIEYEKSELLHDRKCVRIFYLYQRHYMLMLQPRGLFVLWVFCFQRYDTNIYFIRRNCK